jgi:hypothetical protein
MTNTDHQTDALAIKQPADGIGSDVDQARSLPAGADDSTSTPTAAALQADARKAWLADQQLTGAELGDMFGRSERWGRDRISEARANGNPNAAAPAPTATDLLPLTTNGNCSTAARHPNGSRSAAGPAAPAAARTQRQSNAAAELPQKQPTALLVVTVAAVATVALVTMFTSYSHTMDLARLAGQADFVARIIPAAVDGLVIAGSTSLLVDHHNRRSGSPLAWAAVALGLASSMAANVVAVDPTLVAVRHVKWVMAAYAPVALAISGHLLLRMLGQHPGPTRPADQDRRP